MTTVKCVVFHRKSADQTVWWQPVEDQLIARPGQPPIVGELAIFSLHFK